MAIRSTSLNGRIDMGKLLNERPVDIHKVASNHGVSSKPYICTSCGLQAMRSTNHYGPCYPHCGSGCCRGQTKHVFDHERAVLLLANEGKGPGDDR